jgi:hypothetical protein
MCTTVVLVALSGTLASSVSSTEPGWLNEYGKARLRGQQEEKPLAVFIGSGKAGWEQVSREGKLAREVKQLLAQNYVCLYVDTAEEAGKRLAMAFEVTYGPGLVISNHSGNVQAFRHEGDLDNPALEQYLRRFADPNQVVTRTETNPSSRVSYYSPGPVQYTAPIQFSPMRGPPMSSFGSVGRSC